MKTRTYARKPTLALWMLVAVADAALLVATAGLLTVLVILAGLVIVAGGVAGFRLVQRRTATAAPSRPSVLVSRPPATAARRRA
jgi:hypothetical protein